MYMECSLVLKNSIGYSGPIGLRIIDKIGMSYFYLSEFDKAFMAFSKSLEIKVKQIIILIHIVIELS